jgi:hypothetical protein
MLCINSYTLLGNNFLLCKPHGSSVFGQQTTDVRKITIWLLLLLEYEFIIDYKPSITHLVADV